MWECSSITSACFSPWRTKTWVITVSTTTTLPPFKLSNVKRQMIKNNYATFHVFAFCSHKEDFWDIWSLCLGISIRFRRNYFNVMVIYDILSKPSLLHLFTSQCQPFINYPRPPNPHCQHCRRFYLDPQTPIIVIRNSWMLP